MKTISERLKMLRREAGLSIQELAKRTKISSSSLSRYENEQAEMSVMVLIKLAKFYKVSADYILGLD